MREPPRAPRPAALLPLRRGRHVPGGVVDPAAYAEIERAEVSVAVEGVDGGAVIVGEETGSGEVVGAGGEIGGERALGEAEGDRVGGFAPLGGEEEVVVPKGGGGGIGDRLRRDRRGDRGRGGGSDVEGRRRGRGRGRGGWEVFGVRFR